MRVFGLAGAEGLEPSARGFGDRAYNINILSIYRYFSAQTIQKEGL